MGESHLEYHGRLNGGEVAKTLYQDLLDGALGETIKKPSPRGRQNIKIKRV
jgi:hypothetical protein